MRIRKLKFVTIGIVAVVITVSLATAGIRSHLTGGVTAYAKQQGGDTELATRGREFFAQTCAVCHYHDRTATKVGPGLKGLFKRQKLPVSGRPFSEENVKRQLRNPYKNMPSFSGLKPETVQAIVAYLKTL